MWRDLRQGFFSRAACRALQALQDGWQVLQDKLLTASYTVLCKSSASEMRGFFSLFP